MDYVCQKKSINLLFSFFSIVILGLWLKDIVTYSPIINPEFIKTFNFMITPSLQKDIYKIFNLTVTEESMYRPRVLSFLLQYIDSSFIVVMNKVFPIWGARLVWNYISVVLIVLSLLNVTKQFFTSSSFSVRFLR